MDRHKKLINNSDILQYKIEAIACCIMSDILDFYESEYGQKEFAEWKRQQEVEKNGIEKRLKDERTGAAASLRCLRPLIMIH